MKTKYARLIKDTFIFALGSVGSKIILFFLVPLYTNCLTQEQYGTADLIFTVAQVIIPICSLVIFDAVVRFGLEKQANKGNVLLVALLIWLGGSIVALFLMPLTALNATVENWKWYLYFYITLNMLLSILLNYNKVKQKNSLYSITCIIQTIVLALLNIYLLLIKKTGVEGYLLSNLIAAGIAIIVSIVFSGLIGDLRNAEFDRNLMKNMVLYSAPLIFNNLAWWVIQSSDKVMIEILLGEAMVGLYGAATRIPSLINVFVSIFQQSWGISAITEIDTNMDGDKEFYSQVFSVFTFLVLFACIFVNSIVKYFMRIYVGADFYEAWTFVPLLVCAAAFSAIAAYFGSIYGALKKSTNNMITTVVAGIINIVVNMLLIPVMGVEGAVVGTIVSYFILAFVRMKDCLRFVKIDIDLFRLLSNSIIIIMHGILITLDVNAILCSIIAIMLFISVNYRTLRIIFNRILLKRK